MNKIGELYQYKVVSRNPDEWFYEIYKQEPEQQLIQVANECFYSMAQASLAAIGHITLLERGE